MKYTCLLMASGKGERLGLGYNKVLYKMDNGLSIVENAARLFIDDVDCERLIVVGNDEIERVNFNSEKVEFVRGGDLRMDSVFNGLKKVKSEYVLIHDGARPYLKKVHLEKIKVAVVEYKAVIMAVKAKDTIKLVDNGIIIDTLDRNHIYHAQTPQAFNTDLLKKAYKNASFEASDESILMEKMGISVHIVEGDHQNNKITFPEDLF